MGFIKVTFSKKLHTYSLKTKKFNCLRRRLRLSDMEKVPSSFWMVIFIMEIGKMEKCMALVDTISQMKITSIKVSSKKENSLARECSSIVILKTFIWVKSSKVNLTERGCFTGEKIINGSWMTIKKVEYWKTSRLEKADLKV